MSRLTTVPEIKVKRVSLRPNSPRDILRLEGVEPSEDTSAGNASENVCTSSLHHGHEAFVLQDLHTAVDGTLVLGGSCPRGHHHSSPDGVDGVGCQTGGNGDDPSQQERDEDIGVIADEDGLQTVVEAEVETTVDKDTHGRDDKASVQALDAVRLEGLRVDVQETIELALSTLALGVISQPVKINASTIYNVRQKSCMIGIE
jgi:hypothetical protein